MRWFFPSWSGDFRLAPIDPQATYRDAPADLDPLAACVLHVLDPTPGEVQLLDRFLAKAKKLGWTPVNRVQVARREGRLVQDVVLTVPVAEAGKRLVRYLRPRKSTLTALSFADGRVITTEGTDEHAIDLITDAVDDAKDAPLAKKPKDAASVARPTPCCPQCEPGSIAPAREVLLSFLTPEQHEDWSEHRAIVVTGQLSRHRYLLMHRHSPGAVQNTKVCYDLDDEAVIHFHDTSVPPEEEVLAAKLILEHAEPWLRNEATHFGGRRGMHRRFKNPFGGGGDGTESAAFTSAFGRGATNGILGALIARHLD